MATHICQTCRGKGRIKCPKCDGKGEIEEGDIVTYCVECPKCKGEKEIDCPNKYCVGGYIKV